MPGIKITELNEDFNLNKTDDYIKIISDKTTWRNSGFTFIKSFSALKDAISLGNCSNVINHISLDSFNGSKIYFNTLSGVNGLSSNNINQDITLSLKLSSLNNNNFAINTFDEPNFYDNSITESKLSPINSRTATSYVVFNGYIPGNQVISEDGNSLLMTKANSTTGVWIRPTNTWNQYFTNTKFSYYLKQPVYGPEYALKLTTLPSSYIDATINLGGAIIALSSIQNIVSVNGTTSAFFTFADNQTATSNGSFNIKKFNDSNYQANYIFDSTFNSYNAIPIRNGYGKYTIVYPNTSVFINSGAKCPLITLWNDGGVLDASIANTAAITVLDPKTNVDVYKKRFPKIWEKFNTPLYKNLSNSVREQKFIEFLIKSNLITDVSTTNKNSSVKASNNPLMINITDNSLSANSSFSFNIMDYTNTLYDCTKIVVAIFG